MAELEITNRTLKVTGAPRTDEAWWWRWLKSLFLKPTQVDSRKLRRTSYPLSGLQAADLMPHSSDWSFQLIMENGLKSREYWTLLLVMRDYSTKVLSCCFSHSLSRRSHAPCRKSLTRLVVF